MSSNAAWRAGSGLHPRRRQLLGLALLVMLFCAAPTPGDIGGCGQRREALRPEAFFAAKDGVDCERCTECGLRTESCERACAGQGASPSFPEHCVPLVHDGEVCLRALLAGSCTDYAKFLADDAPEIPQECNFCPVQGP